MYALGSAFERAPYESHAAPMSNNATDSVDLDVSTAPN